MLKFAKLKQNKQNKKIAELENRIKKLELDKQFFDERITEIALNILIQIKKYQ